MKSKIFLMNGRGWTAAVLVAAALATIALAGGPGRGQAASSPAVAPVDGSFTVLSADPTIVYQPTPGGNIGYRILVKNGGTSVANHLSLTETIGITHTTTGTPPVDVAIGGSTVAYRSATYVDASGNPLPTGAGQSEIVCDAAPSSASTLTCTISKLDVGATFQVIVLFKTSSSSTAGDKVVATANLAFDSQTNGTANQKTTSYDSLPSFMAGAADGSLGQSIFLPGEQLPIPAGGAGLISNIQMPPGSFLNGIPYVGGSVKNKSGLAALCLHCPTVATDITIPTATSFGVTGPFYDGSTPKPFTFGLTLNQLPNGYKFTGVYHTDANGVRFLIPSCTPTATTPNTTPGIGICVSSVSISKTAISVTGIALQNGSYQFG